MKLQHPQFPDVVIDRDGDTADRHLAAGWRRVDEPSQPRRAKRTSRDADTESTDSPDSTDTPEQ